MREKRVSVLFVVGESGARRRVKFLRKKLVKKEMARETGKGGEKNKKE